MAPAPTPIVKTETMIDSSLAPITLLDPDPPSNLNLPISLWKGTRSTSNPSPHYVTLSYHHLSPSLYTRLSLMSSLSIPHSTGEAFSHLEWRHTMIDKMCALQRSGTWDLVPLALGRPQLDVVGYTTLKLDPMARFIVLKPAWWQRATTLRFLDRTTMTFSPMA